jgi:hypothetical protein
VVLLTAEGGDSELARVRKAGADGHLTKPFQEKALVDKALSLLDQTAEMEVLDLGEDGEAPDEELKLGELELEGDEDLLELTDEVETKEPSADLAGPKDHALDEKLDIDLGSSDEESGVLSVQTDEIEDISFEEELRDIDLADLELESDDETVSIGIDEEATAVSTSEDELEDGSDDDTIDLGLEEDEAAFEDHPSDELEQTGIQFFGQEEERLTETHEEFLRDEEEVSFTEKPMEGDEVLALDKTTIDWGEEQEPGEPEISLETSAADEKILDTGIEEGIGWPEEPSAEPEGLPKESEAEEIQVQDTYREAEEEAEEEGVRVQEMMPDLEEIEFEEIPPDDVPLLEEGLRLELTEEDFAVADIFFEESVRREISRKLQEMVEGIINELAEPIVERVARGIALERTEKIVLEELERIKLQPDSI